MKENGFVRRRGVTHKSEFLLAAVCFAAALVCLFTEGSLMLFGSLGPFFPGTGIENILHINWWVLLLATLLFFKKPAPALVLGWLFLCLNTLLWWRVTDDRSVGWFLYQNGLPLGFLIFSHLSALFIEGRARIAAQS
jgi:hypothetical protein